VPQLYRGAGAATSRAVRGTTPARTPSGNGGFNRLFLKKNRKHRVDNLYFKFNDLGGVPILVHWATDRRRGILSTPESVENIIMGKF